MTFEEAVTELEMALENWGAAVTYEHCKSQAAHNLVFHADRLHQWAAIFSNLLRWVER